MFLITHFGTVLCIRNGSVIQEGLASVRSIDDLAKLGLDPTGRFLASVRNTFLRLDVATGIVGRGVTSMSLTLENPIGSDLVMLRSRRGYVSARGDGSVGYEQQVAKDWECFRLVTETQMRSLLDLVQLGLVVHGSLHTFSAAGTDNMVLRFGEISIPFGQYLRNVSDGADEHELLIFDEWSPSLCKIYDPLVLFLIFGRGSIIEQLSASLRSLRTFGRYAGTIMIATDNDPEYMRGICLDHGFEKIHILPVAALDRMDYVGTRISLLSSGILDRYSPILYADADIVFDKDVNPLLIDGMHRSRISMQYEEHNWLQISPESGSTFFTAKPFPIGGTKGFCAGVMLVPSGSRFRKYFEAAAHCLVTYIEKHGRESIPYYDQSVLNYVLHKLDAVSPSPLTEQVRVWPFKEGEQPRGLVHFWEGRAYRHDRMREYIEELEVAAAGAGRLPLPEADVVIVDQLLPGQDG